MDFNDVIAATSDYQSIVNFVTGDSLGAAIVELIGEVHLKAAITSLEQAKISNDPRARIDSAITHLEAVNAAFETQFANAGFFTELFESGYLMRTARKNVYACSLLSICHFYRKDYALVKDYLDRGEKGLSLTYRMPHLDSYMADLDNYEKSRTTPDAQSHAAAGKLLNKLAMQGVIGLTFFGNPKNWSLFKSANIDFRDVEKEFSVFKKQMMQMIDSA